MTTQTPDAVREAANVAAFHTIYGKDTDPFTRPEAFAYASEVAGSVIAALDSRAGDAGEGMAVAADSLLTAYRQKYARERGGIRENAPFRAEFAALALALNDHRLGFPSSRPATPAPAVDARTSYVEKRLAKGGLRLVSGSPTMLQDEFARYEADRKPAVDAVPAGEVDRLREALTEAVAVLERLPYGDWPGKMYSGKTVAANALIRRARAALSHGEGRK